MKTNVFISLLALLISGLFLTIEAKVINRPAFDFWNSSTLEIDKIEINDTATIFYIDAFFRPNNWIRIDKETYIRESGSNNKLLIKGSEGIKLNEEFWMPESGEASFKLFFPPIGKNVNKIDFIESDCDDCFKIWGIYLESNKKPNKVKLPDEIFTNQNKKNENSSLPPIKFENGAATLSGKILNENIPDEIMAKPLIVYTLNPVTTKRKGHEVKINKDGSFNATIDVLIPTIAYCSDFIESVLLIPGEETKVYIDLTTKYLKQSRYHKENINDIPNVYISNSLQLSETDLDFISNARYLYDSRSILRNINGLDFNQFKAFIYSRTDSIINEINKIENLSERGKQIAVYELKNYELLSLLSYEQESKNAYIIANKIDFKDAENISYTPEKPDKAYYSFLTDFSLNNPEWLYSSTYPYIVSLIRNLDVYNIPKPEGTMTDWKKSIKEILKQDIGSTNGIFYELMVVQEYSNQLDDMKLLTETQIKEMNQIIDNKSFINELISENNHLLKIKENLNNKSGFTINEVPAVSKEEVLDAILAKYRGKVIFVDFWATWCGPCIRAMKLAEPVKADFEGKDVVFLYLTGTTSPMKKWQEMVPDIHGEHYRVSDEQWAYWYSSLEIQGVPTYFIYNKEGELKHKSTGFMGVDKMKDWISEDL